MKVYVVTDVSKGVSEIVKVFHDFIQALDYVNLNDVEFGETSYVAKFEIEEWEVE